MSVLSVPAMPFTAAESAGIRADFPILASQIHGHPLVYLDNAASTQMPHPVLERFRTYHELEHANIHRGVHTLSQVATAAYEGARERVRRWINAAEARECLFVRGATEAINLVAQSYGRMAVGAGDEVLITCLEHHSNIVPWQMLCEDVGAKLVVAPISDAGEVDMAAFRALVGPRTRMIAVAHVSNAIGTVNPVREMAAIARAANVAILVDGAQAAPHMAVDVQDLDVDFYAFSGHKMYGPTGIGVLYGKAARLEAMRPYQGGGSMIRSVSFEKTSYAPIPAKFEAGTPHIAGAIGLGAAIDYMAAIGADRIAAHEHHLLALTLAALGGLQGVRLVGSAKERAAVVSFEIESVHPHDIGTILDHAGVAIRAGHHCAQPLMERMGVPATARASFGIYNTAADVQALVKAIGSVQEVFGL